MTVGNLNLTLSPDLRYRSRICSGLPEKGDSMTKGETKAETKVDPSKGKAVELAVTQIERQYGKGAIMKLGEDAMLGEIPVISTGSLSLDLALGVGGLPKGTGGGDLSAPRPQERRHWPSMSLRRPRRKEALLPSSMQNMPWMFTMQRNWV